MENCPTCNARLKGNRICRRCKTDFSRALEAAEQAQAHLRLAAEAYSDGRFETMLEHARHAFALHRTGTSGHLLACAALLQGNYHLALSAWKTIEKGRKPDARAAAQRSSSVDDPSANRNDPPT
ncbi:hypothetical protein DESC_590044 [Desulfosarcina cetonica]|uniref:hypothetical protein n=1 Tax=Desulfosarcina cetonica TaxID=90730 RepID=UPI0012EDF1A8|nr:hypothetical protein [Desulfosarcina cetonica]VTR67129.1 hypothetical protein DESC_590044 [Desulfosarcina cetonica]